MIWRSEGFLQERVRKDSRHRAQWLRERAWHKWFAWHPVRVGVRFEETHTAWLCMVERRLWGYHRSEQPHWYFWNVRSFEYRAKP